MDVNGAKRKDLQNEGATWREFTLAELLPSCAVLIGTGAVCYMVGVFLLRRFDT